METVKQIINKILVILFKPDPEPIHNRGLQATLEKVLILITRDDISCNCGCGQSFKHKTLIDVLVGVFRKCKQIHILCNLKLIIHCINRCKKHNNSLIAKGYKAVKTSLHVSGKACDFHIEGISIAQLHKICHHLYKAGIITGGLGYYSWGVHIDIGRRRTWGTMRRLVSKILKRKVVK